MRKYIYHKLKTGSDEVVGTLTVETDALANIDNFIVTHVHGELDWQEMVHEGLNIRFGMTMQKKEFFDLAANLGYHLFCYENDTLVLNESIRFFYKPEYLNFSMKQFTLNVAYDEATYEMFVSPVVKANNPFENVKQFLPIVVAYPLYSSYKDGKPGTAGENTAFLTFKANGTKLTVSEAPLAIPQLVSIFSEDGVVAAGFKSGTNKEENCIMFSITKDLNVLEPKRITNLTLEVDIESVFPPFHTATTILNPNII